MYFPILPIYDSKNIKNAYIYPISARGVVTNPYIDDFIESMGTYLNFVNKDKPSITGIFDLLKYLFETDYIFLNWIEDIPDRKNGLAQTIFLLILLSTANCLKKRIIWTMHNKISHSYSHLLWKKVIFKTLLKRSDRIITHSCEGVQYVENILRGSRQKIIYLPHPVKNRINKNNIEKKFDILIWGKICPYKGIVEFLEYLYKNNYQNKYRILVIGIATSKSYFDSLLQYSNQNIIIKDDYLSDAYLQSIISQSRVVLFTYFKSSILSSGALMDSLGFGGKIVGPNVGAFADLAKEGLIRTFNNFDDIIPILNDELDNEYGSSNKLELFLRDNSWDKYAEKLTKLIAP